MNESRILGVHHFPWLQDWGEIYENNNVCNIFRTFLCDVLYSKKKSIDYSHIVCGFHLSSPIQVTQASGGQERRGLGAAGVHDACSYRGDAVRGGGVYVQDAIHGARHGHAAPGTAL